MATRKSEAIIEEFLAHVSKLADSLREAVIQEAHAAFAGLAGGGGGGQPDPLLRKKPGPKPKALPALKKGGGRNRRSPEALEKQSAQILQFVRKNPASRAEDIGKALGLSSSEMALPIAKMLSEGTLRKKGIKRATNYSAPK